MNKIVYISDYFLDEIIGGGELNDNELINILNSKNIQIIKIKSNALNISNISQIKNYPMIISNFINLSKESIEFITYNINYIIYEHDHKYLKSRNPALYKNYIAPSEQIVNYNFYKNAKSIICQSNLHKNIMYSNLKLDNILNISGNLWSEDILEFLNSINNNNNKNTYAILDSEIDHKNTFDAVMYCKYYNYNHSLIKDSNYNLFLKKLSNNKALVFFPKTPETLSRLCVEARMLNLEVITNKNVGAANEEWFNLKGKEMIDFCKQMRYNIFNTVIGLL